MNQAQDLGNLKKMFAEFQKQQKQNKRKTSEEILAKYFVPRKTKETFRILPPKQGRKHIEEAFFHVVTTLTSGGKKKHGTIVYCPAHNDPKVPKVDVDGQPVMKNGQPVMIPTYCPLCAKHKAELAKQDSSILGIKKEQMNDRQLKIKAKNDEIYKEAIKWEAKKFYIIRGIDKGRVADGVKFWRFKHNFKNQGTLDKLLPILEEYMTNYKADFSHPENGTDLSITMTDSEFNGRTYKAISAISFKGKSKLHDDPIVIEQWLEDDITWRDVFLPKKAPGITSEEFLEMIVEGKNPYWDDSDPQNKHWVFPGRPDLEEAANTRGRTFGKDEDDDNFEQASDLDDSGTPITISNMTPDKVGKFEDDAVEVGNNSTFANDDDDNDNDADDNNDGDEDDSPDSSNDDEFDDLPF